MTLWKRIGLSLKWRWLHHVVFRCAHPHGCTVCNWCGMGKDKPWYSGKDRGFL